MADPKAPTRDQLAKVFPDRDMLRRFERLFGVAGTDTPEQIAILRALYQEVAIDSASAIAGANSASDLAMMLHRLIEVSATSPPPPITRAPSLDYIDFAEDAPHTGEVRRVAWNADYDTLDVHHTDGVTSQVGLEEYARIFNTTGVTFNNGNVVGVDPATNQLVKFIADGSYPPLNIIGVATQDIPNNSYGRLTVRGLIHDVDTTGTPYGEVWSAGDGLYVSTTIAGGFTKVKPTAPNLSMPIAQVISVNATTGIIGVRPTIEQRLFYGTFIKTADQTPSAANTAQALTWSSSIIASGISIGAPTSRIVCANAGLYHFHISIQLTSSSASVKNVWTWFRKNGVDIANTAMVVSLDSATAIRAPSRGMHFSMAAGDYMEIMFASDSTAMTVDNIAATAFAPAAPAAILTVNQEQQ